ncbi:Lysosomal amino acid transporter 1-like [Hondaea fermentalgiana]|uniref:Lysosomal amino acid transporter 1-like n=1 Tax=Hondaea fermentalgiana TaxID=2315210 RepID=A0A2R5G6Q7_9STRA|nr:Lysosomal amino acid transporter 1-like [Hondaea fermentalgiana]|eukprot:GBG26009.1 Lysosomal amino acid transporter 1-like [Hondaea fermentalgiana]
MAANGPTCTCYPAVKDGAHFNEWIAYHLGECVYSGAEISSVIVGFSSIGFWIACQMPQIIKNIRKRSASALSKWFLLEWFLGDALNLTGALLTKQLPTQLATAFLFICNDCIMISQLTYYSIYGVQEGDDQGSSDPDDDAAGSEDGNNSLRTALLQNSQSYGTSNGAGASSSGARYPVLQEGEELEESSEDGGAFESEGNHASSTSSRVLSLAALAIPLYSAALVQTQMQTTSKLGLTTGMSSNPVFMASDPAVSDIFGSHGVLPDCGAPASEVSKFANEVGTLIGWISAVVYLNSRLPQIIKNWRRKSVEGLSFLMFFCAVMGNTTYGMGVLLRDSSWKSIHKALPWLVGSLGTLALDFFILIQFWCYSDHPTDEDEAMAELEEADAMFVAATDAADRHDPSARAMAASARGHRRHALDALQKSPARGLYGIKAWNTSPFFKPSGAKPGHSRHSSMPPPLSLYDSNSLGVLPSDGDSQQASTAGSRPVSSSFSGTSLRDINS